MKILGLFGPVELVIILVVVLLIFGPKNLPKLGSAVGKTVKNLREGMDEKKDKGNEPDEVIETDESDVAEDSESK